jgi:hydroxymethylpyrimidine pyrophosphatase-like HAD family hydrolase
MQVIFNKGAVMILPSGVNKASGLAAALEELQVQPGRVVAIGDAENDHALLEFCGFAAAVANAIPALKERAAWVARSANGAGVIELIEYLIRKELW